MPARALFVGLAALALTGAGEPVDVHALFADLSEGALACAEATQTRETSAEALTRRGWTEYPTRPEIGDLARTFGREGSKVMVVVLKRERQCAVNWPVSSPSGPDAVFAAAEAEVSQTLSRAFRRQFEIMEAPPVADPRRHYRTGESIGILTIEDPANGIVLKFVAMNKANVATAMRDGG